MGLGKRLQQRRIELNMTRSQLAHKLHVTPSAIANYENGISSPKPDILISLFGALEVDANYLFQDYISAKSALCRFMAACLARTSGSPSGSIGT